MSCWIMAEESRISGVCSSTAACRSEPPLNRCSGGQRSARRPITSDVRVVLRYKSHDSSNKSVFTHSSAVCSACCVNVSVCGDVFQIAAVLTEGQHGFNEMTTLSTRATTWQPEAARSRCCLRVLKLPCTPFSVWVKKKSAHKEKRTSPPTWFCVAPGQTWL